MAAALAGACSTSSSNPSGQAGSGSPGTGGMVGSGGTTGGGATTGGAGTTGDAGTTGSGTAGAGAGTTGTGGSAVTGVAGTTGSGTAGTTGAGTGGTSAGTAGSGAAGTAGLGGTTGGGGTLGAAGLGGAPPPPACQAPIAITTGTAATVTASLGTVRQTVSPDLMGVHTSVYDNNMQLPTTPELLRAAGVTSLRYPGGSYSDLYHWELHTGTWTPASGGGNNTIYIAPATNFGSFISFMAATGANALITVNYGMNSAGTGPGVPQEAAAWVAYANGSTSSTTSIGADSTGQDWKTVGYWAGLRAAAPLATDDGLNFLRISHPTPVGIKYWEVGNELYGNGFYYGGCGWEVDMHVAYPATGTTCTGRSANAALSPATYGAGVKAFSIAMKAVDPTIKIGGIVVAGTTEYTNWNSLMLPAACTNMDFAVFHWYGGKTLAGLVTVPETDIPAQFTRVRAALSNSAYCPAAMANMPIAVTEWGPNTGTGNVVIPMSTATAAPAGSQIVGLFAAESYANFMEQGALAVHWLELHNASYLAGVDLINDPFTTFDDSPRWGYHGQQMAHFLAGGNDKIVQATISNAGALQSLLKAHASLHADGSVSVMVTNTSSSTAANVTVNVTGAGTTLACVGRRYSYTPVNGDQDGSVMADYIFSSSDGLSVPVAVPPYSTVVVAFPKR